MTEKLGCSRVIAYYTQQWCNNQHFFFKKGIINNQTIGLQLMKFLSKWSAMFKTSILSEQDIKWIFCGLALSCLGRPASRRYQHSNLCHFLLLFPLVLSENKMSGDITTFIPAALIFIGCGLKKSHVSWE